MPSATSRVSLSRSNRVPGNTGLAAEQATQRDAREQETEPANGESDAELGKRILEVVTAGAGER